MSNLPRTLVSTFLLGGLALSLDLGCRAASGGDESFPRASVDDDSTPHGAYRVIHHAGEGGDPEASPAERKAEKIAGPKHRVIFLNGKGGTFKPGYDDSSTNHSSIPSFTATVPAYEKGATAWAAFVACMKDQYSRFDVEVTDVDPGATPHIETVVGGSPGNVGMGGGVGGVSPMNDDCSVVERAVVYVFSRQFGTAQQDCEVAAQETGHALGLDHEYLCQDPMTYLSGCGKKSFQDKDVSCGEYAPRSCMCGGSKQNSVKWLTSVLGAKPALPPSGGDDAGTPPPPDDGGAPPPPDDGGAPPPPSDDAGAPPPPPPGDDKAGPTIASLAPADGGTLAANTTIDVSAQLDDASGVAKAILRWTIGSKTTDMVCGDFLGEVTCDKSGSKYTWHIPVGSGARTWSIRAVDSKGNVSDSATRTLTLSGTAPPPPVAGAPTVAFVDPSDGETDHPGDHVAVRVKIADDGAITGARLLWQSPSGDVSYDLSSVGGGLWGIDLDVSWYAKTGPRTMTVTATDDAGNEGKAVRTITISP